MNKIVDFLAKIYRFFCPKNFKEELMKGMNIGAEKRRKK